MLKDVRAKPLKSLICGVLRGMDIPLNTPFQYVISDYTLPQQDHPV